MSGPADGPATAAMREALVRVRTRYGPAALTDAVALRAALRTLDGVAPADVDALTAVAESGVADGLRAAAGTDGVEPVPEAATGTVTAATGIADADARRACEAFRAAFATPTGEAAEHPAVRWEDDERRTGTGQPSRRRRVAIGVAVLVVAAVAAAVVVRTRSAAEPAPADRYAIDQVAQRYRALGSTLLAGAERCAPADPQPGQTERVECTFAGGWAITLISYDTASRLTQTRGQAVQPAADSVRNARTADTDAAFALDETAGGTSTVYWDAASPRPVSATVSSTRPLSEVVEHFDTRGAPVQRPELPGPAFRSGTLFAIAEPVIAGTDAECGPGTADGQPGTLEVVSCTLSNGLSFTFTRLAGHQDLLDARVRYASEAGKVPGTLRGVGGWESRGEVQGQFAEFVAADDGDAHIYFDDGATSCFALMTHPDLDQDGLRRLWAR